VIDVHSLVPGVEEGSFDATLFVLAHEVAHQWSGRVAFQDPITGSRSTALLGPDGSHWSYALSSNASLLYGSSWRDLGDGTFVAEESRRRYSPLDLYLMGFLAPSEVPPFALIEPAAGVTVPADGLPPPDGTLLRGTGRTIALADVIAAEGERAPDASSSQAAFRAAFVVLVDSGQAPSPEQLAFVDGVRREWANRFFFMTRGRGVMETELVEVPPRDVASDPSTQAGLEWLLANQQADGAWRDDAATTTRETGAVLQALATFLAEPRVPPAVARGATYLDGSAPADSDSGARRLLGLAAAGQGASTPPLARNADGGVGLAPGFGSTIVDTVLVALAARTPGGSPLEADGALEFLWGAQNGDGGWPWVPGGRSGIEPTAWVLQLVAAATPDDPLWRISVDAALVYLNGSVDSSGVFVDDGFTSASVVAEVVFALDAWDALASHGGIEQDALLGMQGSDGSWDGSAYQTALALRALRELLTVNLAVFPEEVALSSAVVIDGEPARVRVVIHGTSRTPAHDVVVRVLDSNGVQLAADQVIDVVGGGSAVSLDLALDTSGHAGTQQLFVVVDPEARIDETTREDNRTSVPFVVQSRPEGPELLAVAGSLVLTPPALSHFPGAFAATATIANLGLSDATGVEVVLDAGGATPAATTVDLPAGTFRTVTLAATIPSAAAPIPIAIRVDPHNVVPESREDDNAVAGLLGIEHTVDVAVVRVTVPTTPVEQGRDVEIGYTIRNGGTVAADSLAVNVSVLDASGTVVAALSPAIHTVAPAEELSATASWRADRAGTFTIVVHAYHHADDALADNEARASITVAPSTTPNLVVEGGVAVSPDPPLASQAGEIRFTIANLGGGAAGASHAEVAVGEVGAATRPLATLAVPALASGEQLSFSVPWTPPNAAPQAIQVRADSSEEVDEFDESDNSAARTVVPRPIGDLVLEDGDIVPSNPMPRPGEIVYVTVSTYNAGGQPVGPVVLELFLGDPGSGGTLIATASLASVAAGERASATFRWDTAGLRGAQDLVARVNADGAAPEQSYENNAGTRRVLVQEGAIAVSEPFFSPNGDGVKDTTEVSFRLVDAGPVEMRMIDEGGRTVRTLEAPPAATGAITWDGRSDGGEVARDGDYLATVVQWTDIGESTIGTARVVLDTNRIALQDVRDPALLRVANLRDRFVSPYVTPFLIGITRDQQAAIVGASSTPFGCGFFRVPLPGGSPKLLPTAWPLGSASDPTLSCRTAMQEHWSAEHPEYEYRWALSRDDEWVVFGARGRYPDPWYEYLGAANLETGELRELLPATAGRGFTYVQQAPDGRFWAGIMDRATQTAAWIQSVDLEGNAYTEIEHLTDDIHEFQLSPDGTRVAMLLEDPNQSLVVHDRATGVETTILQFNGRLAHPFRWTADGNRIVLFAKEAWVPPRWWWRNDGYWNYVEGVNFAWRIEGGELAVVDVASGAVTVHPRPAGIATGFAVGATSDVAFFAQASHLCGTGGYQYECGPWESGLYAAAPIGAYPEKLPISLPGLDEGRVLVDGVSSGGAVAWFYDSYDWGVGKLNAVHNVGNGTAVIRGARPAGGTSIRFDGIAMDAHLESYTVAVRPYRSEDPSVVIRRGIVPVIDAELASWTPPGPGLYDGTLTVNDKAGNTVESSTVVGWSSTPAIANLIVEPQVFSPNGDGRSDATTVSYTVVLPGETEFRISDSRGQVVHRIPRTDLEPGPAAFVWDGRDDGGIVVRDGAYRVDGHGVSQLVEVDATPPDIELFADARFNASQREPHDYGPPGYPLCEECSLVPWTEPAVAPDGGTVEMPTEAGWMSWTASDRNLTGYDIEIAATGSADFVPLLSSPDRLDIAMPARDVRGAVFRGVARDVAGNVNYTPPAAFAEMLVPIGIGDAAAFDAAVSGLLLHDGRLVPRFDLLERIRWYTYTGGRPPLVIPSELPFEPKAYAVAFAPIIGAPIVSYAVEYPSPVDGHTRVIDTANVSMIAEDAIVWDASSLPKRPFDATFVATDATGRTFRAGVWFKIEADLVPCVGTTEEGGSLREQLWLAVNVAYADPEADRLAPGALLRFTRAGQIAPELVVSPEVGPPRDGSAGTFEYGFGVDTSTLSGCEYRIDLEGTTVGGRALTGHEPVQLCGLQRVGLAVSDGTNTRIPLFETYRNPFTRIDWTETSGTDPQAGSIPAFDGYTEVALPWPACSARSLSFVPVFPPGSEPTSLEYRACPRQGGEQPCVNLTLEARDTSTIAPLCTPNTRDYAVTARVNVPEPWQLVRYEAWLESRARGRVADVPIEGLSPASVAQGTGTILTAALADDVLGLAARAEFMRPSSTTVLHGSVTAARPIVVDHTPPAMAIRTPADGQHLCPVAVPQEGGTTRNAIPFEIEASDDWLGGVNLWIRPVGGEWSSHPIYVKPVGGSDRCELPGTDLTGVSYVDAAFIPPGAYEAFVDSQDCSFGSYCTEPRQFLIDEHATLQHVAAAPSLASPDGDGVLDVISLSCTATGVGTLIASVLDESGLRTFLFEAAAAPGSIEIPWDGTDAAGMPLSDGEHRLAIELADSCGGHDTRFVSVTLDRQPPEVQVTSPAPNAEIGATVAVGGSVADPNLQAWTLTLAPAGAPDAARTLASGTSPVTGVLGSFSTAGLEAGDHVLRLAATDAVGHASEAVVPIRIVARQLLTGFAVSPALVSPNGDGVLDGASATVQLLAPATLDLVLLDGTGTLRATVATAVAAEAGTRAFALDAAVLAPLGDADYFVQVTAAAGSSQETEAAPLALDTEPPLIDPATPVPGAWVTGRTEVGGTISDAHLAEWSLTLGSSAGDRTLAAGTVSASGTLASTGDLAGGAYRIRFRAADVAGNVREIDVPFSSDATPPELAISAPARDAYLSGRLGPVPVAATITEANLASASLAADTTAGTHDLWTGASPGPLAVSWDVASERDGPAVLTLSATDLAGNRRDVAVPVVLDSTPPVARIDSPRDGYIEDGLAFVGTASDENVDSWRLEMASGPASIASDWVTLATGTARITSGVLATLAVRPADGVYAARLTVVDSAANESEDVVSFVVDTTAPRPPIDLVATVQDSNDVALSWTASPDPDVVGYRILRGPSAETLSPLPGTVAGTQTVSPSTPDGTWVFAVLAFDGAGLESDRSNTASVEIDTSLPRASIARPASGDRVRSVVDVEGTAYAPRSFLEYRVGVGEGASPSTFVVVATSPTPVAYGTLGRFDTRTYAEDAVITVRVEAEDLRGHVAEARATVTVDNAPPAAPVLLSVSASGSDALVSWRANIEPDLAGYLVLRNGTVANAPEGTSLEDLWLYLLSAETTSYADPSLPDGNHLYQVQAMDRAGNLSPPSNTIELPLDTRSPSAWIASPDDRARLPGPATLVAESADRDIASVRFEARARTDAEFAPIAPPVTAYPFTAMLELAAFPGRVAEVRAVATDLAGHEDPAPPTSFFFLDETPEPPEVRTLADGRVVTISWTDANAPGALAGYRVTRTGTSPQAGPRPDGVASATSSAPGDLPGDAYDGDSGTAWSAGAPGPQRWQVDLSVPVVLDRIQSVCDGWQNFDVLVKVRGLWMTVAHGVSAYSQVRIEPALEVEAVALDYTASGTFSLDEVQLYAAPLVPTPPAVDPNGSSYYRDYTVAATTPFGLTAARTATAHVFSVSASASAYLVRSPEVWVRGYSDPGTVAHVYSADSEIATAPVGANRYFSVNVPLALGANALVVRAIDADGNRSIPSSTLTVTYEPLPSVEVALAVSLDGPDATLTFTATGDVDRVTRWVVKRDTYGWPSPIATLAPAERSFVDRGLPNGRYVYTVVPRFSVGEGMPSNAVEVLVDVPLPPAPTDLRVDVPPEADRLVLTWTYSGPPVAGFVVERSLSAEGPFDRVNYSLAVGLTYDDTGALPGVTTFYRVRAVDAQGNLGPPSNVSSGTLPAGVAVVPRLLSPTSAGRPITVSGPMATVGGMARPWETLELTQNGRSLGTVNAGPQQIVRTPLPTRLAADGGAADVSADGDTVAYLHYDSTTWFRSLVVENLATGVVRTFELPDVDLDGRPRIAPGGQRVAVAGWSRTDRLERLYVADLVTAQLQPLVPAETEDVDRYAWSPDARWLAYTVWTGWSRSLAVASLEGGTGGVVWSDPDTHASATAVAWTGQGEVAIAVEPFSSGQYAVVRIDVATGAPTDVFTGGIVEPVLALSADGGALAFVGDRFSWADKIWILDLPAVAPPRNVIGDSESKTSLAFSPDGRRIAAVASGRLAIYDVAAGTSEDLGYVGWSTEVLWPAVGVVVVDWDGPATVDSGGWFELADVALDPGRNVFRAYAIDASGVRAAGSEPIYVTFDVRALPDLSASLVVSPPVAVAGEPTNAVVTVRNLGGATSAATDLVVRLLPREGSSGSTTTVSLPAIPSGQAIAAPVPLDLSGLAGEQTVLASVDPARTIQDGDRSNNDATATFVVVGDGLTLDLEATPQSVGVDGSIAAHVSLVNGGADADVTVQVRLADAAGETVVSAPEATFTPLAHAQFVSFDRVLAVGDTLAGDYEVVAEAVSEGAVVASSRVPVAIEPERALTLSLYSARAAYRAGDVIDLLATVANESRNAPLADASIRFEIADATGTVVFAQPARTLPLVWVGGEVVVETTVGGGTLAAGGYVARAVVESAGAGLAEATAAFSVIAEPLLAGSVTVAGASDPPVVRAGTPAIATTVLRNVGTGIALAVRAHLVTVDAGGTEVGRITFDAGDLATSAGATEQVSLPTATLALGTYGLVLAAEYDGRTETLATAHFRVVDGRAPELVLLAPSEGSFVRGAVTPSVRASDDSSGVAAVRGAVGGASVPLALTAGHPLDGTWSGAIELGPDGPYEVVISAADAEGNDGLVSPSTANPLPLHLVSDTTPPQVRIDGVLADALVNVVVTPVIVAEDVNLARVDAFLDGVSFGGGAVEADGDHVLVAVANDRAGNSSSASVRFSIDRTLPSIAVVGVDEGAFVATDVTPLIVVTDVNLESYSALLDGAPFSEGATLTAERTYSLTVTARDRAGNTAELVRTFTIDKTPPVIEIAGVRDGAYVPEPVSPVVTVTDPNLLWFEATLDGEPFAYGSAVSTEGFHRLSVRGLDRAGNRAEASVSFVVDLTPPSISIDGVAEGEITARDVVPVVIVEDANLYEWTTSVDGVELPLGGAVTFEGEHLLEVVASDLAGNAASATVRFEIDRTAPAIWASVQDGASYDDAVVVEFGATDRNLANVTATLDGGAVTSGVLVDADGAHVLVVEARDAAGNEARETYGFEVAMVRYAVEKRLLSRHSRVLAMTPCESAKAERIERFLRAALPGVPLALVRTEVDLLVQLRTGLHDVVVVAGGRSAAADSCEPESAPPPLPPGTLAHRVEQELTEAVFRGLGVIVFREEQAAWPQLVEGLGLRFEGDEPAGAVAIRTSAVAEELRLSVPDGVELKLVRALGIGSFERDDGAAAAVHAFGTGAAAAFGFDPSVAEPAAGAERLLAGAVAFVTPDAALRPRGVVAVGIDVTNERRPTSTRVRETVDSALDVVGVLSGGSRLPTGEIEWQFYQATGATERLAYVVRLPQVAGTYPTTTEVASVGAAGVRSYGTYVLDLVLGTGEAELADDAEQLALALPSQGPDAADRAEILARLAAVAANPGSTAADREQAIGDLLAAIDAARALRTLDPTPLRLALDELLAVWEARP
jgi:subtilase family serine protease